MVITYEIDVDDLAAFNLYILEHLPYGKKQITGARATYILLTVLFLSVGYLSLDNNPWLSVYFFILSLVFFVYVFLTKMFLKKRVNKQIREIYRLSTGRDPQTGKHSLTITPDSLKNVNATGESTSHWDIIKSIVTTDQYLIFIINPGLSAYILPKRDFPDDSSFNQFADTAKQYHQIALAKVKTA